MLVEAALAFTRGNRKIGAALLAAAPLAARWSGVGLLVEVGIRAYKLLR